MTTRTHVEAIRVSSKRKHNLKHLFTHKDGQRTNDMNIFQAAIYSSVQPSQFTYSQARAKTAFTEGSFRAAQALYSQAIEAIDATPDAANFVDLWASTYANRALVRLRLQDNIGALQDAEASLALMQEPNARAYYLRAK